MSKKLKNRLLLLPLLVMFTPFVVGQNNIPSGFVVPENTLSPDRHFGVTVPDTDQLIASGRAQEKLVNSVIDTRNGHVLAAIQGEPGWTRQNRGGVMPSQWSQDGSLLLWGVMSRYGPSALVLLKISDGNVVWQKNILTEAQQAILLRTKKAAPEKYATAKEANKGNGTYYPDGFTVSVQSTSPSSMPLHIKADLTSNPKAIPNFPDLRSSLEGTVNAEGQLTVTKFSLAHGHPTPL